MEGLFVEDGGHGGHGGQRDDKVDFEAVGQPGVGAGQRQPEEELEPGCGDGHFQSGVTVDHGPALVAADVQTEVQRRVEEAAVEPREQLVHLRFRDAHPRRQALLANVRA